MDSRDWTQLGCVAYPSPIHPDYHAGPASTIAFDNQDELLWIGTQKGFAGSFIGRELKRFTAFRIHPETDGPLRQFLFVDKGVIFLGSRSVYMAARSGVPIWSIRHESMQDLRAMSFTSKGTSEILVAGWQNKMLVIDVNKGEVVKELPTQDHYSFLKMSRYICAATNKGTVNILDPINFTIKKQWQAHGAFINDLDTSNDFIVTCGGSHRQTHNTPAILDPYVKVFDLKNMSAMNPVPFAPLAAHVRMHPRMLTTAIVVNQAGQIHVTDLLNPSNSQVCYTQPQGVVLHFDVSRTGEGKALADNKHNTYIWGSPNKIQFTEIGIPPRLPDPPQPSLLPPDPDMLDELPLSRIGLPFYREQLFSALPPDIISDVGAPPQQVDQNILSTLTKTEWGYIGPNKMGLQRNQYIDTRSTMKTCNTIRAPKFLSEKAREAQAASEDNSHLVTTETAVTTPINDHWSLRPEAPAEYRICEIKYSKFGVDDFDFGFFNNTQYPGLENNITNSYANSLLQVMHYTPLLRNMALQHAATACLADPCLLCELGYIFDMLQKGEGPSCHATNMLRALNHTSNAAVSGVLEENAKDKNPSTLVKNLTMFLFDKIGQDYKGTPPISTELERTLFKLNQPPNPPDLVKKMLETDARYQIKCMHCQHVSPRTATTFVNKLSYPAAKPNIRGMKAQRITFSQVLKAGLENEAVNKGYCTKCQRYQNLDQRKIIFNIPAVLALCTEITTAEHRKLWSTPGWLPEEIGIIVDQGHVYCYEGDDLKLHLNRGIHNITVYSLVGTVVNVETKSPSKSHLVATVNVGRAEPESKGQDRWHLFNDFSVRSISKVEALTFNSAWKMPVVVMFQVKAANHRFNMDWKTRLDTSVLFRDNNPHALKTYELLDRETEIPGPDTVIAIDTEFIRLKEREIHIDEDGKSKTIRPISHAIARASVVRGEGAKEGVAFIDDYIHIKETIVDYLTEWSGITPTDLDPINSQRNLVSPKTAYKKLWVLVNLGCKFLGHGLSQDFRVINIQVPRNQVIDTSIIFMKPPSQRKISLAFLAWYLLKEDIQQNTHDSIEDAQTALKLYRKYEEFTANGSFHDVLEALYKKGKTLNFKPPRISTGAAKDVGFGTVHRVSTPPVPAPGTSEGTFEIPSSTTTTTTTTTTGSVFSATGGVGTGGSASASSSMPSTPVRKPIGLGGPFAVAAPGFTKPSSVSSVDTALGASAAGAGITATAAGTGTTTGAAAAGYGGYGTDGAYWGGPNDMAPTSMAGRSSAFIPAKLPPGPPEARFIPYRPQVLAAEREAAAAASNDVGAGDEGGDGGYGAEQGKQE